MQQKMPELTEFDEDPMLAVLKSRSKRKVKTKASPAKVEKKAPAKSSPNPKAKSKTKEKDPLFKNLIFYMDSSCDNKKNLLKLIQDNGGTVVKNEEDNNFKVALVLVGKGAQPKVKTELFYNSQFIIDSVKANEVLNLDDYMIEQEYSDEEGEIHEEQAEEDTSPKRRRISGEVKHMDYLAMLKEASEKEDPDVPVKLTVAATHRQPYSADEDKLLEYLIEKYKPPITGKSFYEYFQHLFPGRTWQSLRERAAYHLKLGQKIDGLPSGSTRDGLPESLQAKKPEVPKRSPKKKESKDITPKKKLQPQKVREVFESEEENEESAPFTQVEIAKSQEVMPTPEFAVNKTKSVPDQQYSDEIQKEKFPKSPAVIRFDKTPSRSRKSNITQNGDKHVTDAIKYLCEKYSVSPTDVHLALFASNGDWKVTKKILEDSAGKHMSSCAHF